jgi:hypothetical protein
VDNAATSMAGSRVFLKDIVVSSDNREHVNRAKGGLGG